MNTSQYRFTLDLQSTQSQVCIPVTREKRNKGFETLLKEVSDATSTLVSPTVNVTPIGGGQTTTVTVKKSNILSISWTKTTVRKVSRDSKAFKGLQGGPSEPGTPFSIAKIYSSIAETNKDFSSDDVPESGFVII